MIQKIWEAVKLAFINKMKTNSNSKHAIARDTKNVSETFNQYFLLQLLQYLNSYTEKPKLTNYFCYQKAVKL